MVKSDFPLPPAAAIPLLDVIRLDNTDLQPFYNTKGATEPYFPRLQQQPYFQEPYFQEPTEPGSSGP